MYTLQIGEVINFPTPEISRLKNTNYYNCLVSEVANNKQHVSLLNYNDKLRKK